MLLHSVELSLQLVVLDNSNMTLGYIIYLERVAHLFPIEVDISSE